MLYYISDTNETPNEYAYHMKRLYDWDFDIRLKSIANTNYNDTTDLKK